MCGLNFKEPFQNSKIIEIMDITSAGAFAPRRSREHTLFGRPISPTAATSEYIEEAGMDLTGRPKTEANNKGSDETPSDDANIQPNVSENVSLHKTRKKADLFVAKQTRNNKYGGVKICHDIWNPNDTDSLAIARQRRKLFAEKESFWR
jgi:hypothetical protein